jgi:hypothetical protein
MPAVVFATMAVNACVIGQERTASILKMKHKNEAYN